ncbi:hypothetical protein G9464_11535 [Halostella sp. JP-L12]|uniref:hypothetical protein n=1 Tax=Halostella TaxID=1843185 RepID=UPI000EF802C1|nr:MULTISPECIES: hypothetical protein [Halostella]NHN48230.1 hypothetical protein [Halostella sp. JP-L12]
MLFLLSFRRGSVTPIAALSGALLQSPPIADPSGLDVSITLGGGATGTFLTTLLVGAVMVALVPDYTERMMAEVLDDPVGTFGYGIVSLLVVALLAVLLVVSVVGLLVVIPFVVLAYVVWAFGAAVAFLAIADRLVGHEDGWLVPLIVAAAINGGLTLTGVGGLVALCVGAAGFGAVLRDWLG